MILFTMIEKFANSLKAAFFGVYTAGLVLGILFSPGITQAGNSTDCEFIPPETITGRLSARNGFSWRYSYDISFSENAVLVNVAINLIPADGVTKLDIDRVKPLWEEGIEEIWNNKFSLETKAGQRFPIIVDVMFHGHRFHHDVIVHPGGGRSDELNWNIMDTPAIAAHEFGHMIGLFDEYRGGALAPKTGIIDKTSIMTSKPTGEGMTFERHYTRFRQWFAEKSRLSNISVVPMEDNRKAGLQGM
jgi:hypothetical protein